MGEQTGISWTDSTWNPWIGCTKVSPGCANCYAETLMDHRYGKVKWGKGSPRQRTSAANWKLPIRWNREATQEIEDALHDFGEDTYVPPARPRVFCASLSDWLDEEIPCEWIMDLLLLISHTPALDWLLLTKRPQNWKMRLSEAAGLASQSGNSDAMRTFLQWLRDWQNGTPPSNVWIGTSVEDQKRAEERIPILLKIPAQVRFLSCEPLLGHVNLAENKGIHWVIAGGESGPGARPMMHEWAASLRDQCAELNIAFHFKQWGGVNKKSTGRILEGRTYDELPVASK